MEQPIVILSLNFPPLNDPESFCTARFASALSETGVAMIHVVTLDHPQQLGKDIVEQLVSNEIKITKLKLPERGNYYDKFKFLYFNAYSEYISFLVKETSFVLKQYNNPILITRAYPAISNIVGFIVRKQVLKWIAHFSDPYPGLGIYSRRTQYVQIMDLRWARKIFSKADKVCVTSRYAKKHFEVKLKNSYSEKVEITYHIGYPQLDFSKSKVSLKKEGKFIFAHVGRWHDKRYRKKVIAEFNNAYELWPELLFLQFGTMDFGNKHSIVSFPWLYIRSDGLQSPEDSSFVLSNADINVVIDQDDDLKYCPYLASKFVYAIHSGKPLLAIGQQNSEMALLHKEYGSFYFSDIRKKGDLFKVLNEIKRATNTGLVLPSAELKNKFMPGEVASSFLNSL